MRKFLFRYRKSIVLLLKLLLYFSFMAICFGLLYIHNPQILKPSRTAAVTGLTFIVCGLFMSQIYGGYDIGKRKSKPIVHSLALAVIITDIITFIMLIIMNMNESNNNSLYPYWQEDALLLLVGMVIQIVSVILFTYGGHAIYFSIVEPERSMIITGENGDIRALERGIGKYKKQYRIERVINYQDGELWDAIRQVDTIFLHDIPVDKKNEILAFCYKNMKNVFHSPEIVDIVNLHSKLAVLDDVSMVAAVVKDLSVEQQLIKRIMDIIASSLGLLILSPVLLCCAAAIKLGDGGKILFKQNRVTKDGRIFTIYKFRTMVENSNSHFVTEHDNRITKVGMFLRKYRLDELPQFFNILKGDMSLVGPRPEMTEHVFVYSTSLPEFLYRHRVKAGLTGYAQITGKYNTSAKDKLMMDLMYIEHFSLWNDIKIIFQTILVLFRADDSTKAFDKEAEMKRQKVLYESGLKNKKS